MITTVYCGTQIISRSNSKKSKIEEDEPKKKIQLSKQQKNNEKHENKIKIIDDQECHSKNSFFQKLICCVFIIALLFSGIFLWDTVIGSNDVPAVAPTQNVSISTHQTQQTTPQYKHTRIADIKVGERVVTSNIEPLFPKNIARTWDDSHNHIEDNNNQLVLHYPSDDIIKSSLELISSC